MATKTVTKKRVTPKKERVSRRSGVITYQGSVAYVNCKTSFIRHRWEPYTDTESQRPPVGLLRITLQCENCTAKKHVLLIKGTSIIHSTRYYYPKDYPDVQMDKAEWRDAWVREFYR